jgi:hypothetical protein
MKDCGVRQVPQEKLSEAKLTTGAIVFETVALLAMFAGVFCLAALFAYEQGLNSRVTEDTVPYLRLFYAASFALFLPDFWFRTLRYNEKLDWLKKMSPFRRTLLRIAADLFMCAMFYTELPD